MTVRLTEGAVLGNRYQVLRPLGEGGMQVVYLAKDNITERLVALKTPKNNSATKRFLRSAIVAAKVNHPNMAKTLDYFEDKENQYLIEEYVDGSDMKHSLLDRAPYLDPYLVAKILHHLSKGVAAAHHAGVVHRDLKPTNIMVIGGYSVFGLKITDFGIAKMADQELQDAVNGGDASLTTSQTAVGALPYMAPEAIESPRHVDKPADIWSIGAMTYQLLCGKYPYGQGLNAVPKIVSAAQPDIPDFLLSNLQFSNLAKEILGMVFSCLQKNVGNRPTADELVKRCGTLCYSVSDRFIGKVDKIFYDSYGFIRTDQGNVFYHKNSVYGQLPAVGDSVLLASYDGGGAPRALPVIKLEK